LSKRDNTRTYDLIVIGTGDAGKIVAEAAAREGWRVAIIEKSKIGGTCALWGCVPKKILLTGAELVDFSRRMAAAGLSVDTKAVAWSELLKYKDRLTGSYSQDNEKHLIELGIDIYHGVARFVGRTAVQVSGTVLEGRFVHIATGARPGPLNVEGEEHLTTSGEFLYLDRLPPVILFIGGGYISFEFAHLAASCGSNATIINRSGQVLRKFDPGLAALLVNASRRQSVAVVVNQQPKRIEKTGSKFTVTVDTDSGERQYSADLVVHGAGRIPDIHDLDLDSAGINASEEGININEYMQSISNDRVYAAGDVVSEGVRLTPVAMREGEIVADNLVRKMKRRRPDYLFVPSVVFTQPKLAVVGLQEAEAEKLGISYKVTYKQTDGWLHNQRVNEQYAASRIISDKKNGKILGAHILDSHADDLINFFALAMQHGLTVKDIRDVSYAYPTATSNIQYMIE
jgi:glutathione reductase (NADPH)